MSRSAIQQKRLESQHTKGGIPRATPNALAHILQPPTYPIQSVPKSNIKLQ